MDPGLFFGGIIAGLLISQAWVSGSEPSHRAFPHGPPPPKHPKIAEAEATFLPHAAKTIEIIRATEPEVASSWQAMASRVPYLTESVAMYYAMEDPNVPIAPKLTIAGSLLYLVSPLDVIPDSIPVLGQLDDIGVLLAALRFVYDHVGPEHMEKARQWLISQGVDPKPLFAIGKDLEQLPEHAVAAQRSNVLPYPGQVVPGLPGPVLPPGSFPALTGPVEPPYDPPTGSPTGFGGFYDDQPPAPPPTWGR